MCEFSRKLGRLTGFVAWGLEDVLLERLSIPVLKKDNAINAIDASADPPNSSRMMLEMILSDLSDADLMVRPVPHANHFAWQLGHLIAAERNILLEQLPDAKLPE